MPVGAPPPAEKLEELRAQTVELLETAGLCPDGGRIVKLRKIGGFSARKVAYWVETDEYPEANIPACRHSDLCVDCGRLALTGEPAPEPQPIPPPPPIPQPPPPQPVVAARVGPVEPAGDGAGAPLGAPGLLPAVVPGPAPVSFQLPGWVSTVALWLVGALVVLVAVTISVQGLAFAVSSVGEAVPDVDVQVVTTTSTTGV